MVPAFVEFLLTFIQPVAQICLDDFRLRLPKVFSSVFAAPDVMENSKYPEDEWINHNPE
ncbi:Uncharacterised protein [Yersinia enterocolitica]|uniref:Uncharacterized protein n=1 Tax=Yersinia enterocolitica TaxID=630 RepID=A0ABP1YJV5_YEREN|nr:Uncharacterised protein [Yersinia enterocolitica]